LHVVKPVYCDDNIRLMSRTNPRPNRAARGLQMRPKLTTSSFRPVSRAEVHKMVVQETKKNARAKYIDAITSSPLAITTSGTIGALFNISQGIQEGQRIGDAVKVINITIGTQEIYAYNSDVVSHARQIIFQWLPNIADFAPTVADILETPTVNSCFSLLNVEHSPEYIVLYDHLWRFSGTSTVPTDSSDWVMKNKRVKVPPKPIIYEATSSSGSSGTVCMLTIADSSASPNPAINYAIRTWYTETEAKDGRGQGRLVA